MFFSYSEINDRNKGRKMLEKMGWKKGEGLGKTGDGMRNPVSWCTSVTPFVIFPQSHILTLRINRNMQ